MARGRPTGYNKSRCKELIDLGKEGKLPVQICAEWGISKSTMKFWKKKHPEFMEAYQKYQSVVETFYLDSLLNRTLAYQIIDRIMARYIDQFKDDETLLPPQDNIVVDFQDLEIDIDSNDQD